MKCLSAINQPAPGWCIYMRLSKYSYLFPHKLCRLRTSWENGMRHVGSDACQVCFDDESSSCILNMDGVCLSKLHLCKLIFVNLPISFRYIALDSSPVKAIEARGKGLPVFYGEANKDRITICFSKWKFLSNVRHFFNFSRICPVMASFLQATSIGRKFSGISM